MASKSGPTFSASGVNLDSNAEFNEVQHVSKEHAHAGDPTFALAPTTPAFFHQEYRVRVEVFLHGF